MAKIPGRQKPIRLTVNLKEQVYRAFLATEEKLAAAVPWVVRRAVLGVIEQHRLPADAPLFPLVRSDIESEGCSS